MYLADALSRAYLPYDGSQTIASEVESINMTQDACIKPSTLKEIKQHTAKDESLLELINVIKAGWPETKGELSHLVLPYFVIRDELSVDDGMHGCQGREISSSKIAASRPDAVIKTCDFCRAYDKRQPKETLISLEVPERPWAKVGIDLFSYRSHNYLICVDYYSSFWEIDLLEDTRSAVC